jgi:hypothetical protein
MKNKLIIIVVVGIIFFLYRSNPGFDDHVSLISSDYLKNSSDTKEQNAKIREGLDYRNFIILSITQEKGILSLITIGAAKKVIVVDDKWAKNFIK